MLPIAVPSQSLDSTKPRHAGLLRDEVLVLRQLLGYYCADADTSSSLAAATPLAAKLPGSSLRDVLFVGLDIDTFQGYEQIIPDQQFHIGISILDTRSLQEIVTAPPTTCTGTARQPGQVKIASWQFTVGDSRYCRRASNKYLFGKSETIRLSELKPRLEALVSDRNAVLVLHGSNEDLKVLDNLAIDLRPLFVIDTNKAAQFPLQLSYRYGLEKLLDSLEIPYANLHAAGNDAHFCLRALLMIAVRDAELQPHNPHGALVQALRAVAQAPRPLTAGEVAAAEPVRQTKPSREARAESKARRKARRAARSEQRRREREDGGGDAAAPVIREPT